MAYRLRSSAGAYGLATMEGAVAVSFTGASDQPAKVQSALAMVATGNSTELPFNDTTPQSPVPS